MRRRPLFRSRWHTATRRAPDRRVATAPSRAPQRVSRPVEPQAIDQFGWCTYTCADWAVKMQDKHCVPWGNGYSCPEGQYDIDWFQGCMQRCQQLAWIP